MAQIIDGRHLAAQIEQKIKTQTTPLPSSPHLAVILVGENPASKIYIKRKQKKCCEVGIQCSLIHLPEKTDQKKLLETIEIINHDSSIHACLIQMPLPAHICPEKIQSALSPHKDVDGFHPLNLGALLAPSRSSQRFIPCTPKGICEMIDQMGIETEGKQCVIVGRSLIVGKPLFLLLSSQKYNGTVSLAHSKTKHLSSLCQTADILISAVGHPHLITEEKVKKGAVVIDVGISRTEKGGLVGDVDFVSVSEKASLITPVPGGVGPLTIAMLLKNVVQAYEMAYENR